MDFFTVGYPTGFGHKAIVSPYPTLDLLIRCRLTYHIVLDGTSFRAPKPSIFRAQHSVIPSPLTSSWQARDS